MAGAEQGVPVKQFTQILNCVCIVRPCLPEPGSPQGLTERLGTRLLLQNCLQH